MGRFISKKNPVSVGALKRKPRGNVVIRNHGNEWEYIKFIRTNGGWIRERKDVTSENQTIVSSTVVAIECNSAVGCKGSWAWIC